MKQSVTFRKVTEETMAVVRWFVLETGSAVWSKPMPMREAAMVARSDPPPGASHGSLFKDGTPEFERAAEDGKESADASRCLRSS